MAKGKTKVMMMYGKHLGLSLPAAAAIADRDAVAQMRDIFDFRYFRCSPLRVRFLCFV